MGGIQWQRRGGIRPVGDGHVEEQRVNQDWTGLRPQVGVRSARRLLMVLAVSIFVAETSVMLLLNMLPRLDAWQEALLDASILLGFLAPILFFFVLRPLNAHIAERQHAEEALRERSELLAMLSARMMDAQESEKQRIAGELHERLAQSLAALRLMLEQAAARLRGSQAETARLLDSVAGPMRSTIDDVRSLAVKLRPPTLDDLGLLAALRELCRTRSSAGSEIDLAAISNLADDLPASLQTIVFRVAESALDAAAAVPGHGRIGLALQGEARVVTLTISFAERPGLSVEAGADTAFIDARDRTLLSGGRFAIERDPLGGTTVRAVWWR